MPPRLPDWLRQSVLEIIKPPTFYRIQHTKTESILIQRFHNNEKLDNARRLLERAMPTYLPKYMLNILDLGPGAVIMHPRAIRIDVHSGRWGSVDGTSYDAFPDFVWECRTLPFLNETIDVIFSSHLLEHFWDHERVAILKDWTRVLRSGGRMCHIFPEHPYAGGTSELSLKGTWEHKSCLTEAKVLADVAQVSDLEILEHGWSTLEWDKYIIAEKTE